MYHPKFNGNCNRDYNKNNTDKDKGIAKYSNMNKVKEKNPVRNWDDLKYYEKLRRVMELLFGREGEVTKGDIVSSVEEEEEEEEEWVEEEGKSRKQSMCSPLIPSSLFSPLPLFSNPVVPNFTYFYFSLPLSSAIPATQMEQSNRLFINTDSMALVTPVFHLAPFPFRFRCKVLLYS
jgi:hypothetical protein